MKKVILASVSGIALGYLLAYLRDNSSVDAIVYKAYLRGQKKEFGGNVFCVKHAGNGVLMWNDGNLRCYDCGMEELGGNTKQIKPVITKKPDRFITDSLTWEWYK